jgi:hypothetical protein
MRYFTYRRSPGARPLPRLLSCVAGGLLTTAVAALGCVNDSPRGTTQPPATQPPPTQPPPPDPTFTISGVVFELTASGRRPAAGVPLNVVSEDFAVTTSDADGRYSASVRGSSVFISAAEPAAYMSPCPSGSVWLSINPNRIIDVDVVSKAVLSTTGVPDSYPTSAIFVTGTIVEATSDGPRPVAGALVSLGFEPNNATTLTDTLGRYIVCTAPPGRGTDQEMPLHFTKDGYVPTSRSVLGGWDTSMDVELFRNR